MTPTAGTRCLLHILQERVLRLSPSRAPSLCRPTLRWRDRGGEPGRPCLHGAAFGRRARTWLIKLPEINGWFLWCCHCDEEKTRTYDGVPDLVGKVCAGILEVMFELRSKDILVKIGKRSLGKTWRWEQSPFSMVSELNLILVNPINRLQRPSNAHWMHLFFYVTETPG